MTFLLESSCIPGYKTQKGRENKESTKLSSDSRNEVNENRRSLTEQSFSPPQQ